MSRATLTILLASPRGFCAGVERAIEIVEQALVQNGPPVYVRHEIVHNRHVVDDLRAKGAVFVEELDEVPDNALWCSRPTACPRRCPRRRAAAGCCSRTPPVLWSARSIAASSSTTGAAAPCC